MANRLTGQQDNPVANLMPNKVVNQVDSQPFQDKILEGRVSGHPVYSYRNEMNE